MDKKVAIAKRYKTKELPKNPLIYNGLLCAFGLVMFLYCLISNNGDLAVLKYKLIIAGIMLAVCAFLIALEVLLILQFRAIKKSNGYSEKAVLIDDDSIYINFANQIKILKSDIICVKATCHENTGATSLKDIGKGCLKIKTKTKTYKIPYLLKVNEVAVLLQNLGKYKPLHFDEIVFNYNGDEYTTEFETGGIKFSIDLPVDEDYFEKSVETFKKMKPKLKDLYEKIIKRTAKDMVDLANDWRADDDEHEITSEEIEKRIDKKELYIDLIGESFMIYYNADGLFTDHDFQYCGAPDDEEYSVDIVG